VRGNAARLVRAPTLCLGKTPDQEGPDGTDAPRQLRSPGPGRRDARDSPDSRRRVCAAIRVSAQPGVACLQHGTERPSWDAATEVCRLGSSAACHGSPMAQRSVAPIAVPARDGAATVLTAEAAVEHSWGRAGSRSTLTPDEDLVAINRWAARAPRRAVTLGVRAVAAPATVRTSEAGTSRTPGSSRPPPCPRCQRTRRRHRAGSTAPARPAGYRVPAGTPDWPRCRHGSRRRGSCSRAGR
jgi:hypothetical protein